MCNGFPWKFDVQTSYKPLNCVLGLIFVVNIKFPRATYHTIVPLTEELYCLNSYSALMDDLIMLLLHDCSFLSAASQKG